jgi:Glycosyltransferase family 87
MRNWLWLVLAIIASAVSWAYMHRVLLPWEYYVNVQHGPLKQQMGDLYPRWVGTRELLLNGRNPYGKEVSHEIQMAFYGHPVDQSYHQSYDQTYDKPSNILDEQRFVYPLYVVLLLAPTVHADFATLQTWAPVVLALLTAISVWLWLEVARWRLRPLAIAALVLFVLSSPQIAQGLRLRQFSLFVAFLLALASWCVTRNRYFIAGLLLALSTIKPQMMALCLLWLLLWSAGDWKKRWPLPAGFGIALASLVGVAELLLPGWPRYFLEGLNAYRKYFPTTSPLRLVLGNWAGSALSFLVVAALLAFAWRHRRVTADSPEFVQMLALFFLASSLVLPLLTPFNHVLLLLPLVILLRDWNRLPRFGRLAFTLLVTWPWIASLALLAHPPQLDSMTRLPLLPAAPVLALPFLVSCLIFVRRPQAGDSLQEML